MRPTASGAVGSLFSYSESIELKTSPGPFAEPLPSGQWLSSTVMNFYRLVLCSMCFFVLKLYIEFYCVVEPVLFEEAFLFSETSQIVHLRSQAFIFCIQSISNL